jgi:membrane protease YdiL (CAAX protease family)
MSLTESSPDASPPKRPLPLWRYGLALLLGVAVWPAAWAGLYANKSAALAFVFYHAVCVAGGLLLRSPGLPAPIRLYPFSRGALLGTVAAANVFTLAAYLLVGAALLDRRNALNLLSASGLPPSNYAFLFPYFAIVNPVVEEFFWRGGVYATLRHLFRHWWGAALVSSVLFGAWHWLVIRLFVAPPIALAATVLIMGIGFALAAVYERTRRMAYPVILHALAGDAPLLLLLLLVSRE